MTVEVAPGQTWELDEFRSGLSVCLLVRCDEQRRVT